MQYRGVEYWTPTLPAFLDGARLTHLPHNARPTHRPCASYATITHRFRCICLPVPGVELPGLHHTCAGTQRVMLPRDMACQHRADAHTAVQAFTMHVAGTEKVMPPRDMACQHPCRCSHGSVVPSVSEGPLMPLRPIHDLEVRTRLRFWDFHVRFTKRCHCLADLHVGGGCTGPSHMLCCIRLS